MISMITLKATCWRKGPIQKLKKNLEVSLISGKTKNAQIVNSCERRFSLAKQAPILNSFFSLTTSTFSQKI